MKFKFPSSAKARLGFFAGSGVLVTGVTLILVNLLSQTFFLRLDWSAGARYSLSKASRQLVRSLQDDLAVTVYLSEGVPEPYGSYGRYLKDLLAEYRLAGRGRMTVKFVNPDANPELKSQASSAGLSPVRFTQVAQDQYQARECFMGLVLFYQDKQETIPFIKNTDSLEYDISSRIKRLAAGKKPQLGAVIGHADKSIGDYKKGPLAPLDEHFDVQPLLLSTALVSAPDLVFVMGTKGTFSSEETGFLDELMIKGVPLAFFVDRQEINLGNFVAMPAASGLEPYLAHYGVNVQKEFVLDAQCQKIMVSGNPSFFRTIVDYRAMPMATSFNKKLSIASGLDVLGFPFAHPVMRSTESASTLQYTPVVESSKASWIYSGSNLEPYALLEERPSQMDARGPFALAAVAEGTSPSFSDPQKTIPKVRILVVGTSYFNDPGMPNPPENAAFLLSAAEWLTQDPNILAIPSKGSAFRPLKATRPWQRQAAKWTGLFLLPALVIAAGFIHWRLRQRCRITVLKSFQEAGRA